jgi:hypothetical protein
MAWMVQLQAWQKLPPLQINSSSSRQTWKIQSALIWDGRQLQITVAASSAAVVACKLLKQQLAAQHRKPAAAHLTYLLAK